MKKVMNNTDGFLLSFEQVTDLYKQKKLQLGIDNDLAAQVSGHQKIKGTTVAAFHFYSWVAIAAFFYSIYLSFTWHWWSFIIGAIIMRLIWKANKEGNAQNVVNAAISDADLYNAVLSIKGWMYLIDEEILGSINEPIGTKAKRNESK